MIVISGANGRLGRAVVEELLKRVPGTEVGVSVRDPEKARDLADRGVRVRRGDFAEASSLVHAFEGAARVLIVSSNTGGEQAVGQHRNAIAAARTAGVPRVFYTSHVGASAGSPFGPMVDHAATEAALRASGVAFTVLRNGFYASTVPLILGPALTTGEVALPEDGKVSWTTHADLAEATAILLVAQDNGESTTVNLTASEAWDFERVTALVGEISGRPVTRRMLADDDFVSSMVSRGIPEPRAVMTLGIFQASRLGQFDLVDPTLARLLGRPPESLKELLKTVTTGVR